MLGTPGTFGKSGFLLIFSSCLNIFYCRSSNSLATTLLKEAIDSYISDGGTVYTCFLDMSKAFEHVDHELLLNKLVYKGMPSYVVNMLRTIYSRTSVSVHVHGIFSNC